MNNKKFFKDLFESIPDYRKIVFLMFLIKDHRKLLKEIGLSKNDISQLPSEFKNIILEEHEEYLNCVKNLQESNMEGLLNK